MVLAVTSVQSTGSHQYSAISPEKLKQLYTLMVRLRAHQPRRRNLRGQKQSPYFGQACEVGVVIDLRRGDTVATLPGQHLGRLGCSGSSKDSQDQEGSVAIWNPLEEGGRDRLAIAAGIAFAYQTRSHNNLVVAFAALGEIARASDSVHLAQEQNLPIIYLEKIGASVRKSKPTSHTLPTIPVDYNDAVAVYRVAYEAIDKARRGAGPTLIQCIGHQGSSARGRFVDQRADPIAYMEHYLRKQNLWSDDLRL